MLGMLGLWCTIRWSQGGSARLAGPGGRLRRDGRAGPLRRPLLPAADCAARALARSAGAASSITTRWRRGSAARRPARSILALFFVPYLDSPAVRAGDGPHRRPGRRRLPAQQPAVDRGIGHALPGHGRSPCSWRPDRLRAAGDGRCAGSGSPRRESGCSACVWALVPLLFYAFVARKPGTHVHVATSGLLLLAGMGFGQPLGAPRHERGRCARVGAGRAARGRHSGWWCTYLSRSTCNRPPRSCARTRSRACRSPGGHRAACPTKERFGFPYQAGWKTIGALFADGTLAGSYDSNEQPQVTYWYTRGAWRCSADAALLPDRRERPG